MTIGFVIGFIGAMLIAYALGDTWQDRALFAGLFCIIATVNFL